MKPVAFSLFLAVPAVAQVRVLFQNDLSANTSTSALLIEKTTVGSNASAACAAYNEQLLSSVSVDIRDQLNYLVYRGDLTNSSRVYLGGSLSTFWRRWKTDINVYTVGTGQTITGNGEESLVCHQLPPHALVANRPSHSLARSMHKFGATV